MKVKVITATAALLLALGAGTAGWAQTTTTKPGDTTQFPVMGGAAATKSDTTQYPAGGGSANKSDSTQYPVGGGSSNKANQPK